MDEAQLAMNKKLWAEVSDRSFTQPFGEAKRIEAVEWYTESFADGIPIMQDPDAFILWWVKYCYNWLGRVAVLALLEKNPKWNTEIKRAMVILPSDDGQNL